MAFDRPLPARHLPRWNAVQKQLAPPGTVWRRIRRRDASAAPAGRYHQHPLGERVGYLVNESKVDPSVRIEYLTECILPVDRDIIRKEEKQRKAAESLHPFQGGKTGNLRASPVGNGLGSPGRPADPG